MRQAGEISILIVWVQNLGKVESRASIHALAIDLELNMHRKMFQESGTTVIVMI